MTIREKINTLANENSQPCVTISLNTHRTHPDNSQDEILLKELLKEAIAHGKGLTDLQDIYQAAIDGRGDLLIVHENFAQAVASKSSQPDAIDDITSVIAWEVLSKNGRVVFTPQETVKELGEIALKTRY